MDSLKDIYEKLEGLANELEEAVNSAADSWLAKHLGLDGAIRTAGDALVAKIRDVLKPLKEAAEVEDVRDVLRSHANSWEGVVSKTKHLNEEIDNPYLGAHLEGNWTGDARSSYDGARNDQKGAVNEMQDAGRSAQATLRAVADGVDTALDGVKSAAIAFAVAIAGAIATLPEVVTAPVSIGLGVVAAGALYVAVDQFQSGMKALSRTAASQTETVNTTISDKLGDWPQLFTGGFDKQQDWTPK